MSWNIKTPGDYINGPLTVAGAVTLTGTNIPITEYFADVAANTDFGAALTVRSNANPNVYRQRLVAIRGSYADAMGWKLTTQSGSGTEKDALIVSPSGNILVYGSTTVNTTNYIGASGWAAQFVGSSNGAPSGLSLLSYSASGLPTPASLHVVPIADYRSALIATFSADPSGAGYFAINQFVPTSSSTVERLRVNRNGAVVLGGGTVDANGTGIAFPAAQSASTDANTLDDYEEGSWTPTLTFATPGTLSVSYSQRVGSYTKVGNVVTARFAITINPSAFVKGTASGQLQLSGLPFTVGLGGTQYFDLAASLADQNSGTLIFGFPLAATTGIYFERLSVSGTRIVRDNGSITDANFASTNAGYITMAAVVTYTV